MMRDYRVVAVTILIAITCASFSVIAAHGQATTGRVAVNVMDLQGAPIPGATVRLLPEAKSVPLSVYGDTDSKGIAEFTDVPVGLYRVEADANGFQPWWTTVLVVSGSMKDAFVFLGPDAATIDYNVSPGDSTKPASTVWSTQGGRLPSSPSYRSLLDTAPSTRDEILAGGISIDGSTQPDNTIYIDGHEVTNPVTGEFNVNYDLPLSLLQEVSVVSREPAARFPGSLGGSINVITRGGTSDWHADLGLSFSPGSLSGDARPILNAFGTSPGQVEYFTPNKDETNGYFPHGFVSGPLIKEKLVFLASYSPLIQKTTRTIDYYDTPFQNRNVLETIEYDQTVKREFALARVDASPFRGFRADVRFLWNPVVQDGGLPFPESGLFSVPPSGNGLSGAEFLATRGGRSNSSLIAGNVFWSVNDNFFLSGRAGRSFLNDKLDSYGIGGETRYLCSTAGQPQNVPGSNCFPGFATGPNATERADASSRTSFAAEAGIAGLRGLGRHLIRFGYNYDRLERQAEDGYIDTGFIVLYYNLPISTFVPITPTDGNLGSGLIQRFGNRSDVNGNEHALYVQDSWQISDRVTLDLGLRFGSENVPAFADTEAIEFGWDEKISPRIGIALDPFADGKTRIYAAFGRYFDSLRYYAPENIGFGMFARDYFEILPSRGAAYTDYTYSNILGSSTDDFTSECPISNPTGYSVCRLGLFFGFQPNPFPPPPLIDTDLRPTRHDVFETGAEHVFDGGFAVRARYVRKDIENVIEDLTWFNNQGSTAFSISNPGKGIPCEVTISAGLQCPKPKRTYNGLEVGIGRSYANGYFFDISYTLSSLRGNYSGLAGSDEQGRIAPNVTRIFDLPSSGYTADGDVDDGPLPLDRPHVLKAFGGYTFYFGRTNQLQLSGFTTAQSGTPLTTFYTLYGLETSVLYERGDLGRTEAFTETDFRISYSIRLGSIDRYRLEFSTEILNVFDEENELARQTSISAASFNSSLLMSNGCATCLDQGQVYINLFNGGGLRQYVENYIGSQGVRGDFNLSNRFQAPRSVRFGFRFSF
ncbi:MAG: hypothetical protein DWQ47_05445 [Acidobacteria bacterium]|nr:MAG: hypothetical protein DWQ32_08995 [Acidobacteriota bacterium]REK01826.1 MAG: hypothetical protein DWQ38_05430 [Acidobacteriota bacterium]REK14782.1 MAG: hypothetical protein DWQ43_14685 [Acidobacteriota bacterium]REK45497.1 MAG: hypothetical protein DWQ47_05445 [Acidobacteriota bacterium]